MATATYHREGSAPHDYEIASISDGLCSLKNPDGTVFVTDLPVIDDPAKAETLPNAYATIDAPAPAKKKVARRDQQEKQEAKPDVNLDED
jgi:hypothetical protein